MVCTGKTYSITTHNDYYYSNIVAKLSWLSYEHIKFISISAPNSTIKFGMSREEGNCGMPIKLGHRHRYSPLSFHILVHKARKFYFCWVLSLVYRICSHLISMMSTNKSDPVTKTQNAAKIRTEWIHMSTIHTHVLCDAPWSATRQVESDSATVSCCSNTPVLQTLHSNLQPRLSKHTMDSHQYHHMVCVNFLPSQHSFRETSLSPAVWPEKKLWVQRGQAMTELSQLE